jgi:hypothetical protein
VLRCRGLHNCAAEQVAHGLWFDQAAAAITERAACRLFDNRFPSWPYACTSTAMTVGSLLNDAEMEAALDGACLQWPFLNLKVGQS